MVALVCLHNKRYWLESSTNDQCPGGRVVHISVCKTADEGSIPSRDSTFMKWPTLEGRLKNGFATELEALEQLARTNVLSPLAQKRLERLRKKEQKKVKTS